MNLISGKKSFVVPALLIFLLITTSAAMLDCSTYIGSYGTIKYPTVSSAYQNSELRGVLLKYHWEPHNYDLICKTIATYGFNALYAEVDIMAWTGHDISYFPDIINACNKYGLEFHVLVKFGHYDPSYTDQSESSYPYGLSGSNPNWRMIDENGNYVDYSCFQKISVRNRVKQVIELILNLFPEIVDINFDYVRYEPVGSAVVCYCSECKDAFANWLAENGKDPIGPEWPGPFVYGGTRWKDFAEWRCNPVNNMIKDVRQWALAKNPNLIFTADTWASYASWEPDSYKEEIGQDPAYWISQDYLDALNPMMYTDSVSTLTKMINDEQQYRLGNSKGAIPLVPFITQGGPGADVDSPIPINTWIQMIDTIRQKGCNGFVIWRYAGPGFTASDFTDITPYLSAIRDSTTKGEYPVFKQSRPSAIGSTITWQTSLPTTGKVEYSQTPLFTAIPKTGTHLPYLDIDYVAGTILSEPSVTQNHLIVVPLSPPFYFRIRDLDSNVELASRVFMVSE